MSARLPKYYLSTYHNIHLKLYEAALISWEFGACMHCPCDYKFNLEVGSHAIVWSDWKSFKHINFSLSSWMFQMEARYAKKQSAKSYHSPLRR